MRRTLRLFVYAAAMLVVAVGVAAVLKDDPGYKAGRSEISGKIVGLTEFQENRSGSSPQEAARSEDVRSRSASSADRKADRAVPVPAEPKKEKSSTPAPAKSRPADGDPEPKVPVSGDATKTLTAEADTKPVSGTSPLSKDKGSVAAEKGVKESASLPERKEPEKTVAEPAPAPEKPAEASGRDKAESVPSAAAEPVSAEARAPLDTAAPAGTEKKRPQYERVVTSAKFSMQGSQIKLILQGNAPMVGHYFTLGNPDRVVLDLAGNWEIEIPRVPSNRLIQAVRVGLHDDKTRIVFDMKTTGKVALVPLNRNSLELCIQ